MYTIVLFLMAFSTYGRSAFSPMEEALKAMEPDQHVNVEEVQVRRWPLANSFYAFTPTANRRDKGFIFYPGARVDARAYAPLMRALAHKGYPTFIMRMPFNMAVLGTNRAQIVMTKYPHIASWFVGGHSLGGVSASQFAYDHLELVDGLVLWASYPASSTDLSRSELAVASIYGELDGLTQISDIEDSQKYLPPFTNYIPIPGANHTQFGSYGDGTPQRRDLPATISRKSQQALIIEATAHFLESL